MIIVCGDYLDLNRESRKQNKANKIEKIWGDNSVMETFEERVSFDSGHVNSAERTRIKVSLVVV